MQYPFPDHSCARHITHCSSSVTIRGSWGKIDRFLLFPLVVCCAAREQTFCCVDQARLLWRVFPVEYLEYWVVNEEKELLALDLD